MKICVEHFLADLSRSLVLLYGATAPPKEKPGRGFDHSERLIAGLGKAFDQFPRTHKRRSLSLSPTEETRYRD